MEGTQEDATASAEPKKPADEKNNRDAREEPFERDLRVILTTDQVAERADRLAHLMKQRDSKVELAKAAMSHAKSEIAELDATSRRLGAEVRDKACYMPTRCVRTFDYRTGRVTETRSDTGEIIDERAMTPEERQLAFEPGSNVRKDDVKDDKDDDLDDEFE